VPAGPLGSTLDEFAARVGAFRWVEVRRFEILGGWVPTVTEPEVKLLFARHSVHHGWHAELLRGCLPSTKDHDPEQSTVAPAAGLVEVLTRVAGESGTLERLVAGYQVLGPEAIAAYDRFVDGTNPASDAAARRVLLMVMREQVEQVTEGLAAIETLAARGSGIADAVATARDRFSGWLADVGGLGS
jgi:hypothetical protein